MQSVFSSNTPLSNTGSPNNTFIRGYDGDVEEIAQLRNTYDELLAVLQKSNLKDRVAEVFNLMHDVLEAKEMLITVENYRKSKPGWDIKVLVLLSYYVTFSAKPSFRVFLSLT